MLTPSHLATRSPAHKEYQGFLVCLPSFLPRCPATQLIGITLYRWAEPLRNSGNSTVSKFFRVEGQLPKESSGMPSGEGYCFLRCLTFSKPCVHLDCFSAKTSHHYLGVTLEEVCYPGRNQRESGLCDSCLWSRSLSLMAMTEDMFSIFPSFYPALRAVTAGEMCGLLHPRLT